MGVANTFCDGKATVANYLRPPKLLMVTAILPSQKTKKNTNMIFGDHLVTVAKVCNVKHSRNSNDKNSDSIAL